MCFRLIRAQRLVVPGMGRTRVLLNHSVPGKWDSLREITGWHPEGGWAISPGLPSLSRDSGASKLRPKAAELPAPGSWHVGLASVHLSRDERTEDQRVSLMLELSQRSLLTA